MGVNVKVSLLKCGTCGKPRNPLGHTCVVSATSRRKTGRSKVKPKLSVWTCDTCGKGDNPLTHTCAPKSDFKQRKAAAKRDQVKAKKAQPRRRGANGKSSRQRPGKTGHGPVARTLRRPASKLRGSGRPRPGQLASSHDRSSHRTSTQLAPTPNAGAKPAWHIEKDDSVDTTRDTPRATRSGSATAPENTSDLR